MRSWPPPAWPGPREGPSSTPRMLGGQEADRFLGIQLQKEKELVAILAKGEYKVPIMQTIADKAGLQTPAETVVLSLPVDSMEGLR